MDVDEFIRKSAWGRALSAQDLGTVTSAASSRVLQPDEYLFHIGEPARFWLCVMEGLVVQQVIAEDGRHALLTAASAGTWFGEGTLMKKGRWQYDTVARRTTTIAMIPSETFGWLMDTSFAFNQFIARLLNDRLSHFMGLLAAERLTAPEERMARMLASLYDPYLYPDRSPLLSLNQEDLALLAGMSRQRANVALKKLEEAGLVQVRRSGRTVLDVPALREFSR